LYSAFPVISFHPLRVLPSKSDCQPWEKIDEEINKEKIISLIFMKIVLKSQVKEDFQHGVTEIQSYAEKICVAPKLLFSVLKNKTRVRNLQCLQIFDHGFTFFTG